MRHELALHQRDARGRVLIVEDERALAADILSTALYVMGVDDGLRWADQHDVACCYLLRDGRIRASRAFTRRFPVPARFKSASTAVASRGRVRRATHRG